MGLINRVLSYWTGDLDQFSEHWTNPLIQFYLNLQSVIIKLFLYLPPHEHTHTHHKLVSFFAVTFQQPCFSQLALTRGHLT